MAHPNSLHSYLVQDSDSKLNGTQFDTVKWYAMGKFQAFSGGIIVGLSICVIIALTKNNHFIPNLENETKQKRNLLTLDVSSMCCHPTDYRNCPQPDSNQDALQCRNSLQTMWNDMCTIWKNEIKVCPKNEKETSDKLEQYYPCFHLLHETAEYWCIAQSTELTPEQKLLRYKKIANKEKGIEILYQKERKELEQKLQKDISRAKQLSQKQKQNQIKQQQLNAQLEEISRQRNELDKQEQIIQESQDKLQKEETELVQKLANSEQQ